MLFLISQLQDSSRQKTAPAAHSAPTLPPLAPGARGGGADGGEGAVAAGLRSPVDPCGSPQACASHTGPAAAAGTGWSGGMDGVLDGLPERITLGSVTAGSMKACFLIYSTVQVC